jgi:hypothetical protein
MKPGRAPEHGITYHAYCSRQFGPGVTGVDAMAAKHSKLRAEMEKPIRPSIESPTVPSMMQIQAARRGSAKQHFHWQNNAEQRHQRWEAHADVGPV